MIPPVETRYAKSGKIHIAYQVIGDSSLDLVFVPGWISHVEYNRDDPHCARFLRRLTSFSRLIIFDKRGTGLSDQVTNLPGLEKRVDDVRAVMDALGPSGRCSWARPRAAIVACCSRRPIHSAPGR